MAWKKKAPVPSWMDKKLAPEPITVMADGQQCEKCAAREAEKILQQGDNWRSSVYPGQRFQRYQLLLYDDQGMVFASGIKSFAVAQRQLQKGDQLNITMTVNCE